MACIRLGLGETIHWEEAGGAKSKEDGGGQDCVMCVYVCVHAYIYLIDYLDTQVIFFTF